jgi:predicted amidohydrolase YtcJ
LDRGAIAAVARRLCCCHTPHLDGKQPQGWIPEQKLTVEEALRCYTINNAYAEFEEYAKGSITPGKFADLVVLSENLFAISPAEIANVKVEMTVVDGNVVYQA